MYLPTLNPLEIIILEKFKKGVKTLYSSLWLGNLNYDHKKILDTFSFFYK